MSSVYVQKYLWRDYSQPLHRAWPITLTDNEAIAFMAFITILLAYTQTRVWKIIRLAVNKATRPIQLPDNDNPDSLLNLTQQRALSIFFRSAKLMVFRGRKKHAHRDATPFISLWFGIVALLNLFVFLCLSVLIPWSLTGGLETPVVQSKVWSGCYNGDGGLREKEAALAANMYKKCWYNVSGIRDSCGRPDGVLFDRPVLHTTSDIDCPFANTACHNPV